jgi:tetratricopeptide (TPR) repeat protein
MPDIAKPDRRRTMLVCVALAILTFAVFGQTVRHAFVNYDDDLYVYENAMVSHGLTAKGVAWAFTGIHVVNWHPVTWLSHQLDCQLYGKSPGGPHLTNVILHASAVVLLFLFLSEVTGAFWQSAFVAAVFAIHPLRAESVAWVSERKDVLSGLFFILTIWAYARFVRQRRRVLYVLSVVFFALGLMSKPMLVTIPLVLLVMDFWPLRRADSFRHLLVEKVLFAALSAVVCGITLYAQSSAIHSGGVFSLSARLANALVACAIYLRQMFWPSHLAVLYPYPVHGTPAGALLVSGAVVVLMSILAWRCRRAQPWLLAGWVWYLIMLLPVLGIIQVGRQAHADRYTYLPQIGLYIALTWLVAEWRLGRAVNSILMAAVVAALAVAAWKQTSYWQNSELLWAHTIACTTENELAHTNLGAYYAKTGRTTEAVAEYNKALAINPDTASAQNDLGAMLILEGKIDDAVAHCQRAISIHADFAEAHFNLARAFERLNRNGEAVSQYEEAARLDPSDAEVQNNLGMLLRKMGRVDDALAHYAAAAEIVPDDESVHVNMGNAFLQEGREPEAAAQFERALELVPSDMEMQNNLAWLLATSGQAAVRDGARAVALARQAVQLSGGKNSIVLGTLAAALAEAGQFRDAQQAAEQAIALAEAAGQKESVRRLAQQLQFYKAGRPYHRP